MGLRLLVHRGVRLPSLARNTPKSQALSAVRGEKPRDTSPVPASTKRRQGTEAPRYDRDVRPRVNTRSSKSSNVEARKVEAEEDRVLVFQAKTGDKKAFRKLVERHQRRAFAIAIGLVRDESDANEIVQEAFLRVYRGLEAFEGSSSFFTWLYRIVSNLAIDVMRKPSRRESESLDPARLEDGIDQPLVSRIDGADPQDVVRRGEIRVRIEAALSDLPPYHRGVILMREVEGMSYEEMAEAMGVSKGTIMSRLFHARRKLQRALADCYAEQIGPTLLSEGESP